MSSVEPGLVTTAAFQNCDGLRAEQRIGVCGTKPPSRPASTNGFAQLLRKGSDSASHPKLDIRPA